MAGNFLIRFVAQAFSPAVCCGEPFRFLLGRAGPGHSSFCLCKQRPLIPAAAA